MCECICTGYRIIWRHGYPAIFYGISDIHLDYKTHKSRTEALDIIYDAVSYASSTGIPVRFTAEDASRTDINFLRDVIKTAVEAGADRVSIADTLGILTPEGYIITEEGKKYRSKNRENYEMMISNFLDNKLFFKNLRKAVRELIMTIKEADKDYIREKQDIIIDEIEKISRKIKNKE